MKQLNKLEHLGGQVNALLGFTAALIQSHPEPDKFFAVFLRSAELQETLALNASVSEDFLKGQRDTKAGIEKIFRAIADRKKA
jgi:hypothetical protein